MRNFEAYAAAGKEKIHKYSRYDMQLSDYEAITKAMRAGMSLFEALEKAFNAGIEAGARIERKEAAARALDPKR